MAGRPHKVSFVLQFVSTSGPDADRPIWRGALQEVESGTRQGVSSLDGLGRGLAAHGVDLPCEGGNGGQSGPDGPDAHAEASE